MKNAVIYARYSSERQTEQSIEGQLRVCNEFAEKNGCRIVGTYIDRAISGTTDKREDFQRMIKDSAKRLFEFVIVYKLDRFARNRYDSATNKAVLKKNGVKVLSACEQITDTPEGIILESMLEGYAEYYSAELSQKVRRGLKQSRIKGNFTGGFTLYGYKVIDKKWTVDETQANIIRQIYRDYSGGMRLKGIADKLNAAHIRTGTGKTWTVNILSRLMHNEKLTGVVNADERYTHIVPAIIDKETFDAAVAKLDLNKHRAAVNKAPVPYHLSGKLNCGHCGTLMTGESGTSKTKAVHHYYKCFKKKKDRAACDKKAEQKDGIEKKVVDRTVENLFKQPQVLRAIARKMAEVYNADLKDTAIFDGLLKQKTDNERAIENLLKALEMGIFTPSTKQRLEELEKAKETINCEILVQSIFKASPVSEETVYNYFMSFKGLDYTQPRNRERLIAMFVRKVVVFDGKDEPTIYYNTSDDNADVKENADSETEFGFGALGGR
ncbi:recombinase RecD [Clostridia bacterium]|nr:recombinase RecD [Clostridia bacterium]